MDQFDRGFVVRHLADNFGNGLSSFYPMLLCASDDVFSHRGAPGERGGTRGVGNSVRVERPNLTPIAVDYLLSTLADEAAHAAEPKFIPSRDAAKSLFFHAVAILHSPAYRRENSGALRQDWPRIPLPTAAERLRDSARLGEQLAELLDPERMVPGVVDGPLRPALKLISVDSRVGGGALNPGAGELKVTAGWGHPGVGGVAMPGSGRVVERDYHDEELAALEQGGVAIGRSLDGVLSLLGSNAVDVYLNDVAYWKNVPCNVWRYTIGGYQALKKWLSYRELDLLGCSLTVAEVHEFSRIARRIVAILLLGPQLDASYESVRDSYFRWPNG